ncbi:MAG: ABC transporter ATP-binding protein [Candidatus Methanomethylophilaceae archaeon]|nr:ABC transporter ATP-binding protein [Candidatus Methanomethylophilaceae archaeon]
MDLEIKDMCFGYGDQLVLNNINLRVAPGRLTCVLGPNGVGKSTLMYCINKLQKPRSGQILLDGRELSTISLKELAKMMSFVPHDEDDTFSMSVMDTVLMGRHPHSGFNHTKKDYEIAAQNIKLLGVEDLTMRNFDELSAGQHQRVLIARGLTQEPQILMLDEPTANLDVKYQMLVMRMLKDIARVKGITVLVICHDLNVTAIFADDIVLLSKGGVYAHGSPKEVLTEENISTVYGVECEVTEVEGVPHVRLKDGDYLDSHIEDTVKAFESEMDPGQ